MTLITTCTCINKSFISSGIVITVVSVLSLLLSASSSSSACKNLRVGCYRRALAPAGGALVRYSLVHLLLDKNVKVHILCSVLH